MNLETDEDCAELGGMPGVASVGPMSLVLLPSQLNSMRDLRTAAAQLRGDIVLLYTLDTAFRTETLRIGPLQGVSLGFLPNKKAHVTATCAVAFIDVRTGYVYGVAESSAAEQQRSDHWSTQAAIEKARATAEREAFAGAMIEAAETWNSTVTRYGKSGAAGADL